MRFKIRMNAEGDERFDSTFAQSLVGQRPKLNRRAFECGPVLTDYGQGTIVAAEVVDHGRAVMVTLDVDLPPDLVGVE